MMIARHSCHNHIDLLALALEPCSELAELCDELIGIVAQALLQARHLEVVGVQVLIAKVFA